MDAYHWSIDLLEKLCGLWTWLNTPLFTIPNVGEVAPIGLIGFGLIGTILGLKIVSLINPLG